MGMSFKTLARPRLPGSCPFRFFLHNIVQLRRMKKRAVQGCLERPGWGNPRSVSHHLTSAGVPTNLQAQIKT